MLCALPCLAQRLLPAQVLHPSGAANDEFGRSVAISGDTMIVGAYADDVGANADQGTAHVYRWTGSAWTFEATLIASDGAAADSFGNSVAISGDTAIVGAYANNIGAVADQGSAYVFTRSGTTWTQQAILTASDGAASDFFAISVAIDGDTAVVGSSFDNIGAVADQGSAYVFTRSGTSWTQQAKLTASDGAAGDGFGISVAISGDTVVAGADLDNVGANIDQGSAYIFTRSSLTWTQQAKLTASDGAGGDLFGHSVALCEETAIVGASQDDVGANSNQGSAYIFIRSGTTWTQQAMLTASDGAVNDFFGYSVALCGDTALVGSWNDDIGAITNQGSASVFIRSGTMWTLQATLTAPDGAVNDFLGYTVALSGNTALAGARTDDVGANANQGSAWAFSRLGNNWFGPDQKLSDSDGTFGDQGGYSVALSGDTAVMGVHSDDVGANTDQGSACIFIRSGITWVQQAKLTASDGAPNDWFGFSVAVSGDTAIVGSYRDDIGTTSPDQGSAYIFTRTGTTWTQQAKLTASDGAAGDAFGISVAVSGDTAIVGARDDDIGANPDQGSAYVFTRSGTTWTQQAKLTASGVAPGYWFGCSVAISGETVIAGAYGAVGSAYIFTRSGATWTQQAKLTASDGAAGDDFGYSVDISANTAIVGAPNDDIGANGSQGSAYLFTRTGTLWGQEAKLTASDGANGDSFGESVAVFGDTAIVGSYTDGIGANYDQGSVFIFARSGTTWTQSEKLTENGGAEIVLFGRSVALSGDTAIVGADQAWVGTNFNQGAAWVYSGIGTKWIAPNMKVSATDGADGDYFGSSVALSGDTAAVGAPRDDIGANADQGSVSIYTRPCEAWTQQAKLTAADGAAADAFGGSVALDGDTAIVGASNVTVTSLNQGSAYVFTRSGTTWAQQAKLTAIDAASFDAFGGAVALSGDTAIVGASKDTHIFPKQGSAYIFVRSGTIWTQQAKLTASDAAANDEFGFSVALAGDTAIIGAHNDDAGVNTDQGSAYIFTRSGITWTQQAKLTASDGAGFDAFGSAVALSGDTAIVGAYTAGSGINFDKGAAYIFTRSGATWTQQARLAPSDAVLEGWFGYSTALVGNTAIVGSYTAGIGANIAQGSAYIFTRSGATWTQQVKHTASDGAAYDFFGRSVALSSDTALVGSYNDDLAENTDQGSAYFFEAVFPTLCPGDLSGDSQVDDTDFVLFATAYDILDCADPGMPPGCPADLNTDGIVDDTDFVEFASAYDQLICP